MGFCSSCESLRFPIASDGQATERRRLFRSVARLRASAKTCKLCALFLDAISTIRLKGIRNDEVCLFSEAPNAQGDPIGMSRVFLRVGNQVGRYVSVFTEPDSAAADAGIAAGRAVSERYEFDLYKEWLSTCSLSHSCGTLNSVEALPTRFIKISKEGAPAELHLVPSSDISNRYAALSYCWGGDFAGIKTTAAVVNEHYSRIDSSRLPKTIRDATEITRGLGIEYLWVDSLCIIQDDPEDWAIESKRMAGLYQSATVTIVASAAENVNQGCLFSRSASHEYVEVPISVVATRAMSTVTFTEYLGSIANDFLKSPWNKRAWCLQEYVLSPRLLYFFKDRVVWQCQESLSADDYLELRRETNQRMNAPGHFSLHRPKDLESWFVLVEEYSGRYLTKSGDKLIAVAALATHLRAFLTSDYIAGLWLRDLHKGLLWVSKDSKMQTPTWTRAPSWSWASLDGPVSHLHRLVSSPVTLESTVAIKKDFSHELSRTIASSQALCLTARLKPVTCSFSLIRSHEFRKVASPPLKDVLLVNRGLEAHGLYDKENNICGWVIFDQESFTGEKLFCLQVSRNTQNGTFQGYHVLILTLNNLEPSCYCRVGIGEITKQRFFNTTEECDVLIL